MPAAAVSVRLNPRQRRTRTQRAHCGLTRTAPLGCAGAAPVPPQVCSEYPCAVSTSWLRHAVGGGVGNNILPAIPELHAILTSPTGPSLPPPHQLPRAFLPPAIPSHAALAQRAAPCRGTTRRRHTPSPTRLQAAARSEWLAVAAGGCAAVGALQSTLGKDYVLHAHRRGPRAAHAPAGPRVAQRALRGCGWRGYRRRGAGGCTTRRRSRRIRAAGSTGTRTRTGRTGGCGTTSRGGRCSSALLAYPLSSCSFVRRACTHRMHGGVPRPNRRWGLAVLLSAIRGGRCSSAAAAVRTRALWRAPQCASKMTT